MAENEQVQATGQKKLYVGSLPYSWTNEQLEQLFAPYGKIVSAAVVTDQVTNRSKGFGFVELDASDAAQKAMTELNGKELEGRLLAVREARPHTERPAGERTSSGGYRDNNRNNPRQNFNHQSLDDTESTDTSGRGYGNRRGWW